MASSQGSLLGLLHRKMAHGKAGSVETAPTPLKPQRVKKERSSGTPKRSASAPPARSSPTSAEKAPPAKAVTRGQAERRGDQAAAAEEKRNDGQKLVTRAPKRARKAAAAPAPCAAPAEAQAAAPAEAQAEAQAAAPAKVNSLPARIFEVAAKLRDGPDHASKAAAQQGREALENGSTPTEAADVVRKAQRECMKQRRSARMAFNRSLEPCTKRSSRAEKVPSDIILKIKANPALGDSYFELWMNSRQSWGLVELVEKVYELERHAQRTLKKWLNVMQMLEHYKMESIVASVVAEKLKGSSEWRMNPDAPTDPNAKEFLVVVSDEESLEAVWLRERVTVMQMKLEQEEARHMLGNRIRKPVWCGGGAAGAAATPSAPSGKTPEEIAADEEAKKQKEKEKEEKLLKLKYEREEYLKSDIGRANKWSTSVTKDIASMGKVVNEIEGKSDKVGKSTRDEFVETMKSHIDALENGRQKLELIIKGASADMSVLAGIKDLGDNAQEDVKRWKKIRRIYYGSD